MTDFNQNKWCRNDILYTSTFGSDYNFLKWNKLFSFSLILSSNNFQLLWTFRLGSFHSSLVWVISGDRVGNQYK